MNATDILTLALLTTMNEPDNQPVEVLQEAIRRAIPVIRAEALETYNRERTTAIQLA